MHMLTEASIICLKISKYNGKCNYSAEFELWETKSGWIVMVNDK